MPLNVWLFEAPTSADPLDYDAFVHHIAFRSVFSGLISNYKRGGYCGILAEKWSANQDFTAWEFNIRQNLKFENGATISPDIIAQNLSRIAFLMAKKNSVSELFNNLLAYKPPEFATSPLSGISTSTTNIRFQFKQPVPNLLEILSFGIYSVLHPTNFDVHTGELLNTDKIISSGKYKIQEWSKNNLLLTIRNDFLSEIYNFKLFDSINMIWSQDTKHSADVIAGYSNEKAHDKDFYGPPPSNILYMHCLNWKNKNSPMSSKEFRIQLRELFYKALGELNINITRSFFPLIMPNIHAFDPPTYVPPIPAATSKSIQYRLRNTAILAMPQIDSALDLIQSNAKIKVQNHGAITYKELGNYLNFEANDLDLTAVVTGIYVDDPIHDIKFMFQSKEGIRLPDPTESILDNILSNKIKPQEINKQLIDDAIIWPITHLALGLWVKNHISFDQVNTSIPPTDFSWIKQFSGPI